MNYGAEQGIKQFSNVLKKGKIINNYKIKQNYGF